jgi:hypothetical protein
MDGLRVLLVSGLMLSCATACGTPPPPPSASSASQPATAANVHEHQALHGGVLVELGEEFAHVELVLDRSSGSLTAFVLDGEAEQALRIPQLRIHIRLDSPIQRSINLVGVSNPLTGETLGQTSQFAVSDEVFRLGGQMTGVLQSLVIRGHEFREVPFMIPE